MGKYDFSDVISDVKANLKKDNRAESMDSVSVGSDLPPVSRDPKDYVVMPPWWEEQYGVLGMPYGKVVQIAGDSDTGKTSLCITAMKAAQEQNSAILYIETEMKTSPGDLESWGVDPSQVMIVQSNVTEKAFDLAFRFIKSFFDKYPDQKLFLVFDSFGNTISMHDEELDIVENNQKVGGAAKTNRFGLGRLISLMNSHPIAILLVNYDYDNMGSPGKTQAGGKALKFYTMIGIQSQRTGDWIKTKDGQEVKHGAYVKWTTFKNHYQKAAVDTEGNIRSLPKFVELQISSVGIEKQKEKKKKV